MKMNKAICKMCGKEFVYYPIAESAMDVGKVPQYCQSRECQVNLKYQERTRNLRTGERMAPDKIRHI